MTMLPGLLAAEAPDWVMRLPAINAVLNGLATLLLVAGLVQIKRGFDHWKSHRLLMLAAFGVSMAFLATYLLYHFALHHYTGSGSRSFGGEGAVRVVYFGILISHVVLAAVVPVLAIWAIVLGLRQRWPQHKRVVKWAFPVWLYVSITGVIIYFMLYHWPAPAAVNA